MGKWSERAAREDQSANPCANSAISADRTERAPIGPNDTNGTSLLPQPLRVGLDRLGSMAAPAMSRPEIWPEIVRDAQRLATEGWAGRALDLGWHPLDLWGVSPVTGGIADLEGLAVWLSARRVLLLDDRSCIAESRPGSHAIFNRRRSMDGAVFLWDLGKGRGNGR